VVKFLRNAIKFIKSPKGGVMIEYTLIASLIVLVMIAGFKLIGSGIENSFNMLADKISG
jgi:Flp pilus assembly pilin Flp